jgi:hypothetical protein
MLLIIMVCLFPAFAYDSIKLSHRFAGPIYSVRTALRKLADGEDMPELSFRKGDFWTDMSGDINRIAARLREKSNDEAAQDEAAQDEGELLETASHH